MIARALLGFWLLLCLCGVAAAATPETVETDVSEREIAIESNFTGVNIVVFGTITHSRQATPESGVYDLAVVIRGPEQPVVLRRKSRLFGIWINTDSRTYQNVPGYYAVLSTRPLDEIADRKVLRKYGIGFASLLVERTGPDQPPDPYREAIIRINQKKGLYRKSEFGVTFIGRSLFRATAALPADVPVGEYWADVFVFRDRKLLGESSSRLNIQKQGFERFMYTAAFQHPLFYGIAAVVAAMLAGLIASAIFRRD